MISGSQELKLNLVTRGCNWVLLINDYYVNVTIHLCVNVTLNFDPENARCVIHTISNARVATTRLTLLDHLFPTPNLCNTFFSREYSTNMANIGLWLAFAWTISSREHLTMCKFKIIGFQSASSELLNWIWPYSVSFSVVLLIWLFTHLYQ